MKKDRSLPERQALVDAWIQARADGETQAAFCARQAPPVAVRTLREYLRQYRPAAAPIEVALSIVDEALERLQQLRTSIADRHATGHLSASPIRLPRRPSNPDDAAVGPSAPDGGPMPAAPPVRPPTSEVAPSKPDDAEPSSEESGLKILEQLFFDDEDPQQSSDRG